MNETYVECLVASKTSVVMRFLKVLTIMLTVVFALIGTINLLGLLFALLCGVAAYFVYMNTDLEYEYLYLDREITIDRIAGKSKRKRMGRYEVDKMEAFAPINSYHLDSYKNRTWKTVDYSSKSEELPDKRYVMYCNGDTKLILSPSPEFVRAVQNVAPRKVFMD